MTYKDRTNECPSHERCEKTIADNEKGIADLHSDIRDCWTAIKQKVDFNLSWKVWSCICIFVVILFGILSNSISEAKKDNSCMIKTYHSIDKRLQRIEDKLNIVADPEINWSE